MAAPSLAVLEGALSTAFAARAARPALSLAAHLRTQMTALPVLTVGGDRLTGKSTLVGELRRRLFPMATIASAGTVFRAVAAERGVTVAQLSQAALSEPALDTEIDLRLCELVAMGAPAASAKRDAHLLLLEGRQPAVVASLLRTLLPRRNCVRVRLLCDERSQALRFLRREVGEAAAVACASARTAAEVRAHLPPAALAAFDDEARRDRSDLARFRALYGVDYTDARLYDVIVDTRDPHGVPPEAANVRHVVDQVEGALRACHAEWLVLAQQSSGSSKPTAAL